MCKKVLFGITCFFISGFSFGYCVGYNAGYNNGTIIYKYK